MQGDLATRRREAKRALDLLDAAERGIESLPESRRALARLFVGVRRTEVYCHLGTSLALAKAAEVGQATREQAIRENAYRTYYRAVLLIQLWRAMPPHEFLALLDDGKGDREYLESGVREALAEMERKNASYPYYLRLMQASQKLTSNPAWAVRKISELTLELQQYGEDYRGLRDECNSRLAWHFIELRDFDRAKIFLGEVRREDSRYPRALIDLRQEHWEDAADEARRLLHDDPRPGNSLLLANALEGQARQARNRGDEAQAKRLLSEALGHYSIAANVKDPLGRAAARNGRGDCFVGLLDLDAAEQEYRAVLTELAEGASWMDEAEKAETLKDLGRVAERRGRPAKALALFRDALAAIETTRKRIPKDVLGIAWLEPGQLEAVDGVLRLSAKGGQVSALDALTFVDRMKARGLLDWMHSPTSPENAAGYRATLRKLATARSESEVRSLRLALDKLRSRQQSRSQADALTSTEMRALLMSRPDVTWLSYWTGKAVEHRRMYAIVARGSDVTLHDLGPVSSGLGAYRAALHAVRHTEEDPGAALAAAATFFLPRGIQSRIAADSPLVVSLDPETASLPIEALQVRGVPLGIRNEVCRAPSLAIVRELGTRAGGHERVLVFDSAEPSEEQRRLFALGPLSHSQEEGRLVGDAYSSAIRQRASDATFDVLQARLETPDFDVLHVSCHALNDPRIPSASLLMLTDGPLDMGTLATLRMQGMLAVFSSCASAGSEQVGGEGVKGLLWGPLGAGARGVVASHWEMNQQATKDLMAQFHHHLATGAAPGEAMRRARETLAAAGNYSHPGYWAGFGVYAVPGPVAESAYLSRALVLLGLLGLTVLTGCLALRRR